ncbi:hypothetical protein J2Y66_002458 [Paenarthrobacter nitroguajacolicus]|nr:hypothetical protein [Paenarthrobacter nitroguajacolicus]MDR6987960.1 hypothetical protein [Paenarthrobacter nitroguajacolicus]
MGLLAVEAGSRDSLGTQSPEVRDAQQDKYENSNSLKNGIVISNWG